TVPAASDASCSRHSDERRVSVVSTAVARSRTNARVRSASFPGATSPAPKAETPRPGGPSTGCRTKASSRSMALDVAEADGDIDIRGDVRRRDRDGALDGETKVMDSPPFSIRLSPVLVRLPKEAIGYSACPLARLAEVPAPVVGDRPRYDPPVSDAPDRGSRVPPAERLAEVMEARATPRRSVAAKALHELAQVD